MEPIISLCLVAAALLDQRFKSCCGDIRILIFV